MWGQERSAKAVRCSGCGRKISDLIFNAPNGGSYCEKCATETPAKASPALDAPPVQGEPAVPHRLTKRTKLIAALGVGALLLVAGFAGLGRLYLRPSRSPGRFRAA
jgi:hypothetical protein